MCGGVYRNNFTSSGEEAGVCLTVAALIHEPYPLFQELATPCGCGRFLLDQHCRHHHRDYDDNNDHFRVESISIVQNLF